MDMPESGTPKDLRARAATIRSVAKTLDAAKLLDLHRRAGADVWLGPTPTLCHDNLVQMRSLITGAASDLRTAARNLELRADLLAQTQVSVPG